MKWLALIVLVALSPGVVAQERLVTIPVAVGVQFPSERSVTLLLPQGFERRFVWAENATHADTTFDYQLYWVFNESTHCQSTRTTLENVTASLSSLGAACTLALAGWNTSRDTATEVAVAEARALTCNASLLVESGRVAIAEKAKVLADNATEACLRDRDDCRSQLATQNTCVADLAGCRASQATPATCATYVAAAQDAAKPGMGGYVLAVLIGVVAVLLYLKLRRPRTDKYADSGRLPQEQWPK